MDSVQLIASLAVAAGVAALVRRLAAYLRRMAILNKLPSPPGGALVAGHVPFLNDPRHHRTLLRWEESIGPIYSLRAFWFRLVVVSDPQLIHQLLRGDRSLGVDKSRVTYDVVTPMSSDKGHASLFSASSHSPYWRLVRKGAAPGFSTRCLRGAFPHVQAVCREVLGRLAALGPDTVFDVDNLLCRSTLDLIGRIAFDIDFKAVQGFEVAASAGHAAAQRAVEPEDADIFAVIQESLKELNRRWANPLRGPFLWWLPEVRRAMRYWQALQRHMKRLVAEMRARGPPADTDESIGAHLLRLRDPATSQPLSDDRLLPEAATFFVAGVDTTAHTMCWALYLLAQHPEAEARLCAELEAHGLLATPEHPEPRLVEAEDLGKLSYLAAVVKESMRVLPVSGDGTAVECPRDVQLGGYTIPAFTNLWIHTYSTHNSARYWEQPERFWPERFLRPGAEYAASGPGGGGGGLHQDALRFFPFSQGQRDCIGQSLARMDYTAILAAVLGRFSFRLTPEAAKPGGVRDVVCLTLQPEGGMPMVAVPRVPASRTAN